MTRPLSQICSLMRGGIAERGGVRVGHRIIEINGQSVVATAHEKIVQALSNSVGEVRLPHRCDLWPTDGSLGAADQGIPLTEDGGCAGDHRWGHVPCPSEACGDRPSLLSHLLYVC